MGLQENRIHEISGGTASDLIHDTSLYDVPAGYVGYAFEPDPIDPPTISAAKWLIGENETVVADTQLSQWLGRQVNSGIIKFRYPVTEITLSGGQGMLYMVDTNKNG